VVRVL